jgi:putative membrane protein
MAAAAYWIAAVRVGPGHVGAGRPVVTRFQVVCFAAGIGAIWLASDWPVHDVAEQSMYSVHMIQHLTYSFVAAPLLLLGLPGWMLRSVLRPPWVLRTVRWLCRFVPALVLFNVVLVLTHWPAVVNAALGNGWLHFGIHAVLLLSSLVVWMPIVSPLPEIPRLQPPLQMGYLFLQSVLPTVPASFLTFGSKPLYKSYVGLPHLWGLTTLDDQLVAGLIMKIGGGLLIWMVIAVVFFRWAAEDGRGEPGSREWRDAERELTGPTSAPSGIGRVPRPSVGNAS